MASVGTHCLLELYDCPADLLNDESVARKALREAAEKGNFTLLKEVAHRFEPQGITALGLLAESHISIHTWPEYGYAAVDVFTCGHRADPVRACRCIIRAYQAKRHCMLKLSRGEQVPAGRMDGAAPSNQAGQPGFVPPSASTSDKCQAPSFTQTCG
mgnify:CR=1 FL=1